MLERVLGAQWETHDLEGKSEWVQELEEHREADEEEAKDRQRVCMGQ
jgi:hypothetical protein